MLSTFLKHCQSVFFQNEIQKHDKAYLTHVMVWSHILISCEQVAVKCSHTQGLMKRKKNEMDLEINHSLTPK